MMSGNPFDQERDPVLGALLREHLDPGHSAAFRTRVLARLPAPAGSLWDVLAGWARPGIAAGLLLAALAGYWAVRNVEEAPTAAADVLQADQPIDRDALMAVVLGSSQ
jgi:hypothetical protein